MAENGNGERSGSALETGMGRRHFLGLMGGVAAAAALAGCGSNAGSNSSTSATASAASSLGSGKSKGIGFAWTDTTIEVYKPLIRGARLAADAAGYTVLESNNGGDATRQIADINTWISQGVAGITVLALDPKAIGPVLQKAKDAGVAVIGYSDHVPHEDGSDTFDHKQGGKLLGAAASKWINETLGGKANIAYLTLDTLQVGRDRIGSFDDAVKAGSPGVAVVGRQQAVGSADALKATQSLLQAHPEIDVVICVSDDGCGGAMSALKSAGKDPAKVYIGGFDGGRTALQGVVDGGMIKGVAALPLLEIGKAAVNLPINVIDGKQPTSYLAEYVLADASTLSQTRQLIADFG
jgi:ribose transport system substrate-binding protein